MQLQSCPYYNKCEVYWGANFAHIHLFPATGTSFFLRASIAGAIPAMAPTLLTVFQSMRFRAYGGVIAERSEILVRPSSNHTPTAGWHTFGGGRIRHKLLAL